MQPVERNSGFGEDDADTKRQVKLGASVFLKSFQLPAQVNHKPQRHIGPGHDEQVVAPEHQRYEGRSAGAFACAIDRGLQCAPQQHSIAMMECRVARTFRRLGYPNGVAVGMNDREVAASGQLVGLATSPSNRVSVPPQIAPGAPPLLAFRYYEGQQHHRFNGTELMLDDAGH